MNNIGGGIVIPYQELANAIIVQAVDDIRFYRKRKDRIERVIKAYPQKIKQRAERLTVEERKKDKRLISLKNTYAQCLEAKKNYTTAVSFLGSEWYKTLTDVDAEYILKRLERERK